MEANTPNLTCNDPSFFDGKIKNDEEFEKDGVVYCKRCQQPRTVYSEFFEKQVRVPCHCEQMAAQIQTLREKSLLGRRFEDVRFDNTEMSSPEFEKVFKRLEQYCKVAPTVLSRGIGVYLYGEKGRGKTHLTACMVNALTQQLHSVLFTNFSQISQAIRSTFNKNRTGQSETEILDRLSAVDFLFIDDFGTEKVTRGDEDLWLQGKIYDIINDRYVNKKPIILTSNYSLRELVEDRGMADKTVDRIMEMTAIIKLEGISYRRHIHQTREVPF